MPQMSPLMWGILYFYFSFSLILVMMVLFNLMKFELKFYDEKKLNKFLKWFW